MYEHRSSTDFFLKWRSVCSIALPIFSLLSFLPCFGEEVQETEVDILQEYLAEHKEVIEGMPASLKSDEVFSYVVEYYQQASDLDEYDVYLQIGQDYPNSNLGLYSLREWLKVESIASGIKTDTLKQKVDLLPDTRLSKLAFSALLADAPDKIDYCEAIAHEYIGKAVGYYALEKQLGYLHKEADCIRPVLACLKTFLSALDVNTEVADSYQALLIIELSTSRIPLGITALSETTNLPSDIRRAEGQRILYLLSNVYENKSVGYSESDDFYLMPWILRDDYVDLKTSSQIENERIRSIINQMHLAFSTFENGEVNKCLKNLQDLLQELKNTDNPSLQELSLAIDLSYYLLELREKLRKTAWADSIPIYTLGLHSLLLDSFNTLKSYGGDSPEIPGLLLRLVGNFEAINAYTSEIEVIDYLCKSYPDSINVHDFRLRAASVNVHLRIDFSEAAQDYHEACKTLDPASPEAKETALLAVHNYYMAEIFDQVLTHLNQPILAELNVEEAIQAALKQGLALMRMGKTEPAVDSFKRLRDKYPDAPEAEQAHFLEGYSLFLNRQYKKSILSITEFLESYPGSEYSSVGERILRQIAGIASWHSDQVDHTNSRSPKPNVVLISLDTIRPDGLSCYGGPQGNTPNIDAIASKGTKFNDVFSTSPWTKPSHASLFTSLYPSVHGATSMDAQVRPECLTLSQILKENGYITAGVVSAPPLHSLYGFNRGFDFYDDYTFELDRHYDIFSRNRETGTEEEWWEHTGITGSLITDVLRGLVPEITSTEQSFFLFVNFFDAHHNYIPPAPFRESTTAEGDVGISGVIEDILNLSREELQETLSSTDINHLKTLYNQEIRYVDHQVGKLVQFLKDSGSYDNTLFIIFGDHGEEFLEHGQLMHAKTLYQEVLHVPLIIAGPGVPTNTTSNIRASLVDILPTLLPLLGQDAPEYCQGLDLLDPTLDLALSSRPLYAEVDLKDYPAFFRAVYLDDHKLIQNLSTGSMELYEYNSDLSETRNLSDVEVDLHESLKEFLDSHKEESEELSEILQKNKHTYGGTSNLIDISQIIKLLESYGYLTSTKPNSNIQ